MKAAAAATAVALTAVTWAVWPQPTPTTADPAPTISVADRYRAADQIDRSTRDPLPGPSPITTPKPPPPPPEPESTPVTPPPDIVATSDTGVAALLPEPWESLARCESGLNPTIVSANGLYHGLFQFTVGTWAGVGGVGLPSQATVAEQLKRAQILQASSGWGPWPVCGANL